MLGLGRLLALTTVVFCLSVFAACGGGGEQGGTSEGTVQGDTGVPDTTPPNSGGGTTPPATNPPPTNPPTTPPPDPPPTIPPANPPPSGPQPPTPLPEFASHDGFEDVHCVTVDPQTDTLYAIRKGTGDLLILSPGQPDLQLAGPIAELGAATGLAFDPDNQVMYVAVDGGTGNDDTLHTLAAPNQAEATIGPITGYTGIESLAYRNGVLYAVDSEKNELLSLDVGTGAATSLGTLGGHTQDVRALVYDANHDVLLAADPSNQACVVVDSTSGQGSMGAVLRGDSLRAMAFAPGTNKLFAVTSGDQLREIDPRGSWIGGGDIRALAHDPAQDVLYGVHKGHGLLIDVHPTSGWKQPIGVIADNGIADNGIEGLAFDPSGPWLYALSDASKVLYRVVPTDATATTVGTMTGVTTARSLAFAGGSLYTVEPSTTTLFRVDPNNAVVYSLTSLPGHQGVQSLTFDPTRGALLAYADTNTTLFYVEPTSGSVPVLVDDTLTFAQIGGLAWIDGRVVGTDLANQALVTLEEPVPVGLGFDTVHALAVNEVTGQVVGCDVTQSVAIDIDLTTGNAALRHALGTAKIEGMTFDSVNVTFLAADPSRGLLLRVGTDGTSSPIGTPGSLGTGIRALAHVPAATPILLGYDSATGSFVTIDLSTGVPTALGTADPTRDVQAMTFDVDTGRVLALDRAVRTLMEVDPSTGDTTPFATVEPADVRGMTILTGTAQLILSDATLDEVVIVDRFTGDTIVQSPADVHRGSGNEARVTLLWPRGAVRPATLRSLAFAVTDAFAGKATLEVRQDGKVIHKQLVTEPERMTTVVPVAAGIVGTWATSGALEWALTQKGKTVATAPFQLVTRPDVRTKLARIEANPYLQKHSASVRELVAVRILHRAGLHSEALCRALGACAGTKPSKLWWKTIAEELQALGNDAKPIVWDASSFVLWLGGKDGSAATTRTLMGTGTQQAAKLDAK